MRLNKYIASVTEHSRRAADDLIAQGRVKVNGILATTGVQVAEKDKVEIDNRQISSPQKLVSEIIIINKPEDYVCSKDGQGKHTVYDLLPFKYSNYKIAGRLDADSTGLVILTNDGDILNQLTHPSFNKKKVYEVELSRDIDKDTLTRLKNGVNIGDLRPSKLQINSFQKNKLQVTLTEGRNRQIRRTFEALGYRVARLNRISIAEYRLGNLNSRQFEVIQLNK